MRFVKLTALVFSILLATVAADVSDATIRAPVTITNQLASTQSNLVAAFPLSSQGIIDAAITDSTLLDAQLCSDSSTCPTANELFFAPAPVQDILEGVRQFDTSGSAFTSLDAASQNATADDMSLFDADPEVGDILYFGGFQPFRVIKFNTGTAGDWTGTLIWEQCTAATCSSVAALANVVDNTEQFTESGTTTIQFDMPASWSAVAVNGTTSYWVRARISAFTSSTVDPVGTQAWADVGQWWAFVSELMANEAETDHLFLGGTIDRSFQHYTLADAGMQIDGTVFTSSLPGGGDWSVRFSGVFDYQNSGSARHLLDPASAASDFFQWDSATDGEIDVFFDYDTNDCTLSNVATGIADYDRHTIELEIDLGTHCRLLVDDVEVAIDLSVSGNPTNVWGLTDLVEDSSMLMVEEVIISLNVDPEVSTQAQYKITDLTGEYTYQLIENAADPGTGDAVPSIRFQAADVSGATGAFVSTSDPLAGDDPNVTGSAVDENTGLTSSTFAAAGTVDTDLPGYTLLNQLAGIDYDPQTGGTQGIPVRFFFLIFATLTVMGAILFGLLVTRQLWMALFAGGLVLVLWVVPGNVIAGWAIAFYGLAAGVIALIHYRLDF